MSKYAKAKLLNIDKTRNVMIKNGFTQRGLAECADVSVVTISTLFNGGSCGPVVARKICDTLGLEFDDIFFIDCDSKCNHQLNHLPEAANV